LTGEAASATTWVCQGSRRLGMRSPHAHAELAVIETAAAAPAPGVVAY
jgi:hypothetical protein